MWKNILLRWCHLPSPEKKKGRLSSFHLSNLILSFQKPAKVVAFDNNLYWEIKS